MTDTVQIREATIEDVPQLDPIRRAIFPWFTASVAAQENWFRVNLATGRALRVTALIGDRVVGFAQGRLNTMAANKGEGSAYLIVDPGFRGRGIAKALWDRAEEHLRSIEAHRVQATALDDEASLAWAQRQGLEIGANERWSVVDPRDLPAMPETPAGVEIVDLQDIGPEAAHAVDAAFLDEPGDVPGGKMAYEEFLDRFWNSPDLDRQVSVAAVVDGKPAATALMEVNRETGRAMSSGTATLREFRGRGLAKLMKSVALRRAAEAGVTAAFTGNDYTNAPMLAVNDWLGYRIIGGTRSVLKKL